MAKLSKKLDTSKRQLAKGQLPHRSAKKSKPSPPKVHRVKHFHLRASRSKEFIISFRKFRTAWGNRSRKYRQLVLPVFFTSTKEVAIKLQKRQPRNTTNIKKSFRWSSAVSILLILIGLSGAVYFALRVDKKPTSAPVKSFSAPAPAPGSILKRPSQTSLPASKPTRIRIPAVGIDANIIELGQAADGTLQTPDGPSDTGWYKDSPTPGEIGPSIIVGHVDWINNVAVFWKLRELKPDDSIEITRADGTVAIFKVASLKEFRQDAFPSEEVYGNIDHSGLRLITCGGTFNPQTNQYDHNTVVFASFVKST